MNRPSSQRNRTQKVGFGHAWIAGEDDERAVARGDGFGYAQVASERAEPGHLGTDRARRLNPRSVDAEQIRPVARIDPEGRVLLVALERQSRVLETVTRQGRSSDATKPPELLAPAQRCECVHADDLCSGDAHSRVILPPLRDPKRRLWRERACSCLSALALHRHGEASAT